MVALSYALGPHSQVSTSKRNPVGISCSHLSTLLMSLQVVKALTDLKIVVSRGDDLSLRRAITYFLNNIAKQTQEQETIAAIGEDMFAVALDQPFRSMPVN